MSIISSIVIHLLSQIQTDLCVKPKTERSERAVDREQESNGYWMNMAAFFRDRINPNPADSFSTPPQL